MFITKLLFILFIALSVSSYAQVSKHCSFAEAIDSIKNLSFSTCSKSPNVLKYLVVSSADTLLTKIESSYECQVFVSESLINALKRYKIRPLEFEEFIKMQKKLSFCWQSNQIASIANAYILQTPNGKMILHTLLESNGDDKFKVGYFYLYELEK